MTSPKPISIWDDVCGYCWKKLNPSKMIFIRLPNRDINWACGKRCLKGIIKDELEGDKK